MDCKHQIITELDNRLQKLSEHKDDNKPNNNNQFEELNHAISSVVGAALQKEISSIKDFVQGL